MHKSLSVKNRYIYIYTQLLKTRKTRVLFKIFPPPPKKKKIIMKNVLCMSWNPDKSEKKTLPFLCFMAFYYLFKVKVFCVSTQQILGEIKCPFFSFCLLFSTIASGIFKPKNPACDLSALIVLH